MESRPSLRATLAYVAPFATLLTLLATGSYIPAQIDAPLRVAGVGAAIWCFSRGSVHFKAKFVLASTLGGMAIFVLWIAPDVLIPRYREHWVFQNGVTGRLGVSIPSELLSNPWLIACRAVRAVVLAPVAEELFWRGWLMRWLIAQDFERVPVGSYTALSFWVTAIFFASEHGPYWDVGLVAGILYNWWCLRTRSLGDCILAHAVTNAALAGYVLATHRWEYWM